MRDKAEKLGSVFHGRFEQLERRDMLSAIPMLSSNPASLNKIFLDFDGHVVTHSFWTQTYNNNNVIHARAYDIDGNDYDANGDLKPDAFGPEELAYIDLAFRQMSEDFAPFDVDVTTIEPPASYFTEFRTGEPTAHRVLFTSNYDDDEHHPGTGNFWATTNGVDPWSGVAEFNSWNDSSDSPAFVFVNGFNGTPRALWIHPDDAGIGEDWGPIQEYIGLVGSHEVGHAMDLHHDGVTSQTAAVNAYLGNPANGYVGDTEYYGGHTTGATDAATSWGTIMGGSELRSLTQWSKGDYEGANNTFEDDLAEIASRLGYRNDDHGGTIAGGVLNPTGATPLTLADGFVAASGIIERSSSTTNDYDVFEIDLGATSVDATIRIDTPAPVIVKEGTGLQVGVEGNFVGVSNLDVEMRIYEEGNLNAPLYTINPDDLTNAVHTFSGAGKYYVVVDGVGYTPAIGADYGYSDYGSLGQYTLTAVVDRDLYYVSTEADQVDATNDDRWFSLREAVIAANTGTEPAFIRLPQGRYTLDHVDIEADDASYNDLDITGDVKIVGVGAGLSVIDSSGLTTNNENRAFDVIAGGASLHLSKVTIASGTVLSNIEGKAIRVNADSALTLEESAVVDNHTTAYGSGIYVKGGDVTLRRSVFTGNGDIQGAALTVFPTGGVDPSVVTIGHSIFALNRDSSRNVGWIQNIGIHGSTATLINEGYNLYDGEASSFFGAAPQSTDHLGTVDYVVTTVADTFDHNDDGESLSIREAVALANGDTTQREAWLPAWDFTLTRDRANYGGGSATDTDVSFGDIDISESLVLRGVSGHTSVAWKAGVVDEVFELLGDYNNDGDVNAPDYTTWYNTQGSTTDFRADGDDDGDIDEDDYDIWVAQYGKTLDLFDITS